MEAFAIPFLLLVGGLLALQAAANVQLSAATGSPFGASTLQLGLAAAVLGAVAAVAGTLGAIGRLGEAEAWHLAGGLGSAVYITAGILLFPRLGAVVSVGLFIAGQMAASLALDGWGLLDVAPEPVGATEIGGAVAVLVGAALIVRSQAGAAALRGMGRERAGWILLAVAAGAVLPIQGAVNAGLRTDLDAPVTVGAFSFLIATAAMAALLAATVTVAEAPAPRLRPLGVMPWWGWLGAVCGATYVTSVFLLIPEIGAAPTIALTVAGQQLASMLVDHRGLLRLARRPVTRVRLAGVSVVFVGVALIQVA